MDITVKGAVDGEVYIQAFSTITHFASPSGTLVETLADGSQVYRFNLAQYANAGGNAIDFKSFRLCVKQNLCYPINGQVVISNISVVNQIPQA